MEFLPALRQRTRTKAVTRAVSKEVVRRANPLPRQGSGWASPEAKAILTSYISSLAMRGDNYTAKPWPVERAVTEGYDRVMWCFKSVNTIATDHARLPYKVREGDDGDPLDDHPLYRLLNKEGWANPLETGQIFRKRLSSQISLSKAGAFVEITWSRMGTPIRLDLLPPGRTIPIPPEDPNSPDLIDYWELTRLNGRKREIPARNVLWFRDPHPLDPYSGVTPLESAGLSTELDYFARLYNVVFMRNDGRPGGIVGVEPPGGSDEPGDMDDDEMKILEEKFGHGVVDAGKLTVINGRVTYTDTAANPRDMAYGVTAQNSKTEILSAFGVPESVLGFAANRTYANAEQELYNYWTRTMLGHDEIVLTGFELLAGDGMQGFLDTSSVEVLERGSRAIREEARAEVAAGLRSIRSYAVLAGYGDEVEDTAEMRALWVPTGKTPMPATEADKEALGLGSPTDTGTGGGAPGGDVASPAAEASGGQSGSGFEPPPGPGGPTAPSGPAGPETPISPPTPPRAADSVDRTLTGAPNLRVVGGTQAKVARPRWRVERKAQPAPTDDGGSEPDPRVADRLEDAVAAALGSLAGRWTERAAGRLESPKARKGTRHWIAEHPVDTRLGTKAVDGDRAVDADRWAEEAQAQARPLVTAAAVAAALALASDMGSDDDESTVADVVANTVEAVMRMLAESARGLARALVDLIRSHDADGLPMSQITDEVRDYSGRVVRWGQNIATVVATGTVNGARDAEAEHVATAGQAAVTGVQREWRTRRDDKVRQTHREAEGQVRDLGEPFLVGGERLRYPGDPFASPAVTYNCRCRLRHRWKASGRFAPRPAAARAAEA